MSFDAPLSLKSYINLELDQYLHELQGGRLQPAWRHLERAHVLSQPFAVQHTLVHWKMLLFGIKIKSIKEVLGQIPRLLVGGVKSFVGKVPVGNTGGANIPPLRPLPIEEDLQQIFKKCGVAIK